MKGLDNYIMGINDPNAPFNQIDWTEDIDYSSVLERCTWITDKMLANDNAYDEIGQIFHDIFEDFIDNFAKDLTSNNYLYADKYLKELLIETCAQDIANEVKERYDESRIPNIS